VGYRSEPGGGETRKAARLAECCYEGYHPAGGAKTGNHQKKLVAYFRHTFSSILKANGEDVKVVQELFRHNTSRMTLDTYTQALSPDKRAAQGKVVSMIGPKPSCTVVVPRNSEEIRANG